MISAKKAREMIEDVSLNKEQLESTFSHLEKMIIAACDKKEYSIQVDLENPQLAYDVKLCLGNKALRKHVTKKMEKNGFKGKYEKNTYMLDWNDDDNEEKDGIEYDDKPATVLKSIKLMPSSNSNKEEPKTLSEQPKEKVLVENPVAEEKKALVFGEGDK